jgi:hypothetical protein
VRADGREVDDEETLSLGDYAACCIRHLYGICRVQQPVKHRIYQSAPRTRGHDNPVAHVSVPGAVGIC